MWEHCPAEKLSFHRSPIAIRCLPLTIRYSLLAIRFRFRLGGRLAFPIFRQMRRKPKVVTCKVLVCQNFYGAEMGAGDGG